MLNNIDVSNWGNFKVGDIFPKLNIKKLNSVPEEVGEIPFITSTSLNNGVSAFVNTTEGDLVSNVITVSTNGNCFDCFYQDKPVLISCDVEVLKNEKLNKYTALFIATILKLESYKWSYGRKQRMIKCLIRL